MMAVAKNVELTGPPAECSAVAAPTVARFGAAARMAERKRAAAFELVAGPISDLPAIAGQIDVQPERLCLVRPGRAGGQAAPAFPADENSRRCAWRDQIGPRLPLENLRGARAVLFRSTGLRGIRGRAQRELQAAVLWARPRQPIQTRAACARPAEFCALVLRACPQQFQRRAAVRANSKFRSAPNRVDCPR